MCVSHGDGLYQGQRGDMPAFMDLDLFKSIVSQYKALPSDTKIVAPQFQGESLMHPRFLEFCEILEGERLPFSFVSNGMLMSAEKADALLAMKYFRGCSFSMDGARKETVENIRIGSRYETLCENIRYFASLARAKKRDGADVFVGLSYTMQPENQDEFNDFVNQWIAEVDRINVNIVAVDGRPTHLLWQPKRFACQDLFHFMIVLTDGTVVPCCRDYTYSLRIGNLTQQTLDEIWYSERYTAMRELQLRKKYAGISICGDCDTWMTHSPECRTRELAPGLIFEEHPFWGLIKRTNNA